MNRREKRRFKAQWDSQIEQERNGAPIPGEIAARMTKPKEQEALFQVTVENRQGRLLPVGPMVVRQVADEFRAAINTQIALGQEKMWRNPIVVPCTLISQGIK